MNTVLVADDEKALVLVVSMFLEMLGLEVASASDGAEALAIAETRTPALIITDNMMPRMTGLDLVAKLRANPHLRSVPVVMTSAVRPEGLDPAIHFLKKPFDIEELERIVLHVLGLGPRPTRPDVSSRASISDDEMSAREEMVNWVAHQIKSPLAAATANLQLLDRRAESRDGDNAVERENIRLARRALSKISTLVNSLLDASRLAEGKVLLRRTRTDVSEFLRRVLDEWREIEPKATFELSLPSEPVTANIDESWLAQAVDNLLSNALKYAGPEKPVRVVLATGAAILEIRVEDRGPGIAAAEMPHLFKKFRRAESSSRGGHGLGLYIVQEVARLHGGTATARSDSDGTTFVIAIPTV